MTLFVGHTYEVQIIPDGPIIAKDWKEMDWLIKPNSKEILGAVPSFTLSISNGAEIQFFGKFKALNPLPTSHCFPAVNINEW